MGNTQPERGQEMIAEVTIHLGQEWRDLAYCLFGMAGGGFLGWLFTYDWHQRNKK
jgi:hypothetical protein